jgi:uncharacterized protein YjiS (DUF1127 family)
MHSADGLPGAHWLRSEPFSARPPLSGGRRIRNVLKGAWRAYWRRRTEHATLLMLRSLDDRELKDIGIHRSEIESVVYGARDRRRGFCGGF